MSPVRSGGKTTESEMTDRGRKLREEEDDRIGDMRDTVNDRGTDGDAWCNSEPRI